MTREEDYPNSSHYLFPYYFSDVDGINWRGPTHDYDLSIYYDSQPHTFIDCRCSRWDVDNYQIIVETWLKKADLKRLRNNVVPGAVEELYTVLGEPVYYDKTWTASNTLKLMPISSSRTMKTSTLNKMRRETVMFPKNIVSSPIKGSNGWYNIKIEGYVSSNQNL